MKNKLHHVIFAALCLALCAIPALGLAIDGPSPVRANETVVQPPKLYKPDGGLNAELPAQTAEYVNNRFFLRPELISWYNAAVGIFGSSGTEDVLRGRGGWLFYASTLDDYAGLSPMSGDELKICAKNLSIIDDVCRQNGAKFIFAIAPNKCSLYPEYMPSRFEAAKERDAQRLMSLLDGEGVGYVDWFTPFSESDETLYFAHDSHWNSKGAALAADCLISEFGGESDYFADGFSEDAPHAGDLYEMLYPAFSDGETDPVYGGELSYEFGTGGTRPDSITITTTSGGEGKLLAYRDSFGNSLYPYLAAYFAKAEFSRSTDWDFSAQKLDGAQFALLEIVERNLDSLANSVPATPAPKREAQAPEKDGGVVTCREESGAPEGYKLWRGELPKGADAGESVLIFCGDDAYEAFLLSGGEFAANLPENSKPDTACVSVNGERLACRLETAG